jgi:hypothetical protein
MGWETYGIGDIGIGDGDKDKDKSSGWTDRIGATAQAVEVDSEIYYIIDNEIYYIYVMKARNTIS